MTPASSRSRRGWPASYADPVHRESHALALTMVIEAHAWRRFKCPEGCKGSEHDCDGCRACDGGKHRQEALLSLSIADTVAVMTTLNVS